MAVVHTQFWRSKSKTKQNKTKTKQKKQNKTKNKNKKQSKNKKQKQKTKPNQKKNKNNFSEYFHTCKTLSVNFHQFQKNIIFQSPQFRVSQIKTMYTVWFQLFISLFTVLQKIDN